MVLAEAGLALSGIGAIGGLLNSGSQARAIREQNNIAFQNYLLQRQIAMQQLEMQQRQLSYANAAQGRQEGLQREQLDQQRQMATAGQVDSRGNRIEYVPGVGWVTTPSQQTRALQTASDAEEMQRLTTDAIRSRMRRGRTEQQQLREGAAAEPLLAELTAPVQETPADVRGLLVNRNVARAMSGRNEMRSNIGRSSLRRGDANPRALAELGRDGRADTRTAIAEAAYDAPVEAAARRTARLGDTTNRYNVLASRASAPDDVPFAPTGVGQSLSQLLAQRASAGGQISVPGVGAIPQAQAVNVPQAPQYRNAESRWPVALDALGSALTEFGKTKMGTGATSWLDNLVTGGTRNNNNGLTATWEQGNGWLY